MSAWNCRRCYPRLCRCAWNSTLPAPSKPLRRSRPPERRTPVRKRNAERAAKRRDTAFGFKAEWIREQPCCVRDCHRGSIEAAHVRSRGAGGTRDDLVPLCAVHHREQHTIGTRTFEWRYGCDLAALAERYEAAYRERGGAPW